MSSAEIVRYIDEVSRLYQTGKATEHSYRPALLRLLEGIAAEQTLSRLKSLKFTNEPKRVACGGPDYIVTLNDVPVGYIEAKDVGADLDGKAHKAQFDRYKESLDNIIFTDYIRWVVDDLADVFRYANMADFKRGFDEHVAGNDGLKSPSSEGRGRSFFNDPVIRFYEDFLSEYDKVPFTKLKPSAPEYFFVPKDYGLKEEYEKGFSVRELFPVSGSGIVSKRDALAFQNTKEEIFERVKDIHGLNCEEIKNKYTNVRWGSRDGKVEFCKNNVMKYGLDGKYFVKCDYRPFDTKWTYYTGESRGFIGWPVQNIMRHFLNGENVGLIMCRQQKTDGFYHCMIHKHIVESSFVSNNTSETGYSFPLYLCREAGGNWNTTASGITRKWYMR
jgi:hypothetical protein